MKDTVILFLIIAIVIGLLFFAVMYDKNQPDQLNDARTLTEDPIEIIDYRYIIIDGVTCIYIDESAGYNGKAALTCDFGGRCD